MKSFLVLIIWILVTLALSYLGNWALGFLSAFLILPFYRMSGGKAMLFGLLVGGVSWGLPALMINLRNEDQLAGMIGTLLSLDSGPLVVLITATLGAIGVSLGAWLTSVLFRPYKLIH
ncbi:MAG: hypothetical protein KDC80_16705 [Saprospiraceae bacterium]|nr:hypothetical protein [Saprospiraceae bacterium]